MKKVFLHIGTHKTGSTSIQNYLFEHEEQLRLDGIALYRGVYKKHNHIELYLGSMRYDRDSIAKQKRPDVVFDTNYTDQIAKRVQNFILSCNESKIILTTEGLSLLRHKDEIDRLLGILDCNAIEITVILYLRNRDDFLRSYTLQLLKKKGREPSQDYWSALYVEPDTWLIDFETLVSIYKEGFGENRIVIIDYDKEMELQGNIIPSFLEAIGFNSDNTRSASSYFKNRALSKK